MMIFDQSSPRIIRSQPNRCTSKVSSPLWHLYSRAEKNSLVTLMAAILYVPHYKSEETSSLYFVFLFSLLHMETEPLLSLHYFSFSIGIFDVHLNKEKFLTLLWNFLHSCAGSFSPSLCKRLQLLLPSLELAGEAGVTSLERPATKSNVLKMARMSRSSSCDCVVHEDAVCLITAPCVRFKLANLLTRQYRYAPLPQVDDHQFVAWKATTCLYCISHFVPSECSCMDKPRCKYFGRAPWRIMKIDTDEDDSTPFIFGSSLYLFLEM